jgi:GNAT superfamily N-acetyltransferase
VVGIERLAEVFGGPQGSRGLVGEREGGSPPTPIPLHRAADRFHRLQMSTVLRQARTADIPAMHRVRMAVRENRLATTTLGESDCVQAIEATGRGWVVEVEGRVVAFAVGNRMNGNIWALFVDPACERKGYGRLLHDAMLEWLCGQGLSKLWLTTEPGTRAERFYESAGWSRTGSTVHGELRFERSVARESMARPE